MANSTKPCKGTIQYLLRDSKHDHEKPYYLYYEYGDSIPRTNTVNDGRLMSVYNARELPMAAEDMFHTCGFAQVALDAQMLPSEYQNPAAVREVLYPKCKAILRAFYPDAARIEVLEHGTRMRDPLYPRSQKERHEYSSNQPSDYAHIDYTASSAEKSALKRFGIHPEDYRRTVAVNIWKPIIGPVYDWPLVLCDRRTISHATQTISMDVVTQDYVNENTRIYNDPGHQWYFWEGLTDQEALVFIQSDSDARDKSGVPHTAFEYHGGGQTGKLRHSLEVRLFAFFE